ncbi:MAG TPA: ABC transporter substrate-binding protein [Cyclobacteriaceae bacterium]|nr:ABC transporter substrate-binding protein [Cyclobacteriaceae bacterium]
MKYLSVIACIIFFVGCNPEKKESETTRLSTVTYAKGFTVSQISNAKLVEVLYPYQGATSGYKYLLVPKGEEVPAHEADTKVIQVPIETIVCTSTTHIPLLDYLDATDRLVGFPTMDYISSEKTRKRIDEGKIQELGTDKGLNIEQVAVLKPSLVMGYTMTGDYGQFRKIEELGIPVVINAEYLEEHPLGRAEWIKFMALFLGKEKEADEVFRMIEKNYLTTRALAEKVEKRPTILSGVVYSDAWFMPGGQNYAAKLFNDAGCEYLWSSDSTKGFLQLSFESVYEKAHMADFWIGVGSFNTLDEMKNADERYTKFTPYQTKQVFTYNARKGAKGGSEFLELGYLRPDMILNDLVKIAHPELLPEYQLYFHKKLE